MNPISYFLYWRIIKRKNHARYFQENLVSESFFELRDDFRSQVAVRPFVLQLLEMRVSLDRPDELSLSISSCPLVVWGRHLCYTMDCTFSQLQQDFDERQSVGNDPRLVRRHWVALIVRDRVILWDVRCTRVAFLNNVFSDQTPTSYTSVQVLEQFTFSWLQCFSHVWTCKYQRNITLKKMCAVRWAFCVPFVSACSAVADSGILLRFFTKRITCFNAHGSRSASLHSNPSFPSDTWWTVLTSNSVLLLPVTVCAVLLLISRWLLLPSSSFPWAALSSRQLSLLLDTARPPGVQLLLHGRVARTRINTSSLVFPHLPVTLNPAWLHALFSSWTYRQCVCCMTATASFTTWRIPILLLAPERDESILRAFLFWQFSVELSSSLCVRDNVLSIRSVFVGFLDVWIRNFWELFSFSFLFFLPWRVDIVFASFIRCTLPHTFLLCCQLYNSYLSSICSSKSLL